MAATVSTKKPTRVSERIGNLKKAATAAAIVTTKNTNIIERNRKPKGKATPSKVNKPAPAKKAARSSIANAKKPHAVHHRFFLEPEQLSNALQQHHANDSDQMWVGGVFHAAGPGEKVPDGSIEMDIKVPEGLKFLCFPEVLKLVEEEMEEEEMEEEVEMEEDEHKDESSDSELSECGYISNIHV
jgi:hypothetical protein